MRSIEAPSGPTITSRRQTHQVATRATMPDTAAHNLWGSAKHVSGAQQPGGRFGALSRRPSSWLGAPMSHSGATVRLASLVAAACTLLALSSRCLADGEVPQAASKPGDLLPDLWEALGNTRSYRMLYELDIMGSSETVAIEEWADFDERRFRLDLMSPDNRLSYLTLAETDEIFRYKPYTCDRLAPDSRDLGLIGALFAGRKLPAGNKPPPNGPHSEPTAFGLGLMWLHAREHAKTVKPVKPELAQKSDYDWIAHMRGYDVEFDWLPGQVAYKLRFYFETATINMHSVDYKPAETVSVLEWLEPSTGQPEARARLLTLDLGPEALPNQPLQLPAGYGCHRSDEDERQPPTPGVWLPLLHEGGSNQALFDVVASSPQRGPDSAPDDWRNWRHSVRAVRGSFSTRLHGPQSFYVTISQDLQPDTATGPNRQIRRVYLEPSPNQVSDSSPTDDSRPQNNPDAGPHALVYTIDELSNRCLGVQRQPVPSRDTIMVALGPEAERDSRTSGALALSSLAKLFTEQKDFHLLHEDPVSGQAVYERRSKNLSLGASWSGPASIVKIISGDSLAAPNQPPEDLEEVQKIQDAINKLGHSDSNPETSHFLSSHEVKLEIYFYSDDFATIESQLTVGLVGRDEFDLELLENLIDVSACQRPAEARELELRYPLDSQSMADKLTAIQDVVDELLLINLFLTTPVLPLQVGARSIEFDSFFMYARLTFQELPLTHVYDYTPGFLLAVDGTDAASGPSDIIQRPAVDVLACANTCQHYTCFAFAYEPGSRVCQVKLDPPGAGRKLALEVSLLANLYQFPLLNGAPNRAESHLRNAGRTHLSPKEIVSLITELVKERNHIAQDTHEAAPIPSKSTDGPKRTIDLPLVVRLRRDMLPDSEFDTTSRWLELVPEAVLGPKERLLELERDEESGSVRVSHLEGIQTEYKLLLDARAFKNNIKGMTLHKDLSYDECAAACELADCRSFSYNQLDQENCILSSNLHRLEDIEAACNYNSHSSVFALDYLSKFEAFGRTSAPESWGIILKDHIREINTAKGAHQCAGACIEASASDRCQGFYLCGELQTCLLSNIHLNIRHSQHSLEDLRKLFSSAQDPETAPGKTGSDTKDANTCSLYSRSYLAQFELFEGRKLETPAALESSTSIVKGAGAELCAMECLQTDPKPCLAFHVCATQGGQECVLHLKQARSEQVHQETRCNLYSLADRSQLASSGEQILAGLKPNRHARVEPGSPPELDLDAGHQSPGALTINQLLDLLQNQGVVAAGAEALHGAGWFSYLVAMLLGALLGLGFVFGWRRYSYQLGPLLATRLRH